MKHALIISALLLITISLKGQTKVCFQYDAYGNRTNRDICFKSIPVVTDSVVVAQPITENLGEITFTLYPNPTKGQLTVMLTNMHSNTQGDIALYDLNGRQVLQQNSLQETSLLDISGQPIGVYVLRIRAGDKVSEWKVIKE